MSDTTEMLPEPPAWRYGTAWLGGGFPLEYPTEEEHAMATPPKGVGCVVKVVTLFHTSYYEVVGCKSAKLVHRHR